MNAADRAKEIARIDEVLADLAQAVLRTAVRSGKFEKRECGEIGATLVEDIHEHLAQKDALLNRTIKPKRSRRAGVALALAARG